MTYYANYTLLRLKHCLRRHIEARHVTSSNEDFRLYSPLSVLQSGQCQQTLRTAVCSQEFKIEENRAARRKLRAN